MNNTISKTSMHGVYIPLLTPMRYGQFDAQSMTKLIRSVDPFVDGFVPTLSTGEGNVVTPELWAQVVGHVRSVTTKPVIAGIKRDTLQETIALAQRAQELGCDAFIIPVPSNDWNVTQEYLNSVIAATSLPFVIYNTEGAKISELAQVQELDQIDRIIAIKDSSMNREFFARLCQARLDGSVTMGVLQGMEHMLDVPAGCDGYLVSLANAEPQLVRDMYQNQIPENNQQILRKFMQYNLGSDWYITLKALLYARGTIASAEQVQQFVVLNPETLAELQRCELRASTEFLERSSLK